VYSQACLSGKFDNADGFAEHMTIKTHHGAFATVMNARYGWGSGHSTDGPSQRYHREFWDAVFGEEKNTLGQANHDSKEDNLYRISESCMRWCYYETNLFGDPTLMFYQGVPEPELEITQKIGLGISADITNIGDADLLTVPWNISFSGGVLLLPQTYCKNGEITIGAGDTEKIRCIPIGFGPTIITIKAASATKTVDAIIIGFVVIVTS